MKIRAKGDRHKPAPISENFRQKNTSWNIFQTSKSLGLKVPVCIACIYLAIPPPGMKTVSPSSPVPRPEEDTRDVFNKFESSNNLNKLFENPKKRRLGLASQIFSLTFPWRKILVRCGGRGLLALISLF
jgi:hypothetical protein